MEGQEQFTVSLQSLGSDTRIRISAMPSTITINDDDGMLQQSVHLTDKTQCKSAISFVFSKMSKFISNFVLRYHCCCHAFFNSDAFSLPRCDHSNAV